MEGGTLRLHRVFSSLLDGGCAWYAVSSEMADGKISEFTNSDIFKFFPGEIHEIDLHKLTDQHGDRAKACWFGSRKRDTVVVSTVFGLLARSLRRKNLAKDKFIASSEFSDIKNRLKSTDFLLAGEVGALFDTPPNTPENEKLQPMETIQIDNNTPKLSTDNRAFLADLKNGKFSSRKKAKRDGFLAVSIRNALKNISDHNSSEDLGLVLGNAVLFGGNDEKDLVQDIFLTTVDVVKQRKGIKDALSLILTPEVLNSLYEEYRVPDWQQLYVKLVAKLPDKAWQTILNFLHAGRTKVRTFSVYNYYCPIKMHQRQYFEFLTNQRTASTVVFTRQDGAGLLQSTIFLVVFAPYIWCFN